ncbi:MAG: peptidoglycan editing factor PgeF [Fusobacteriaceae bacterium]|nr:peptidoglycan editing factor PgeF [Fusobacteriaceae bacterium]
MWIDHGKYLEQEAFSRLGATALCAGKSFGDAKSLTPDQVTAALELGGRVLISTSQTHGDAIVAVRSRERTFFPDCDGLLTDMPDVILYMKFADCLPIFFLDPEKQVIGIVHAGWKGTLAEIGIKALALMESEYRCDRSKILIAFGVGISGRNYEVSPDFYGNFASEFGKTFADLSFLYFKKKLYFDNQKFNRLNFLRAGIPPEHIFSNDRCTFADPRFFSYRREKNNPGRNAGIIYRTDLSGER